MLVTSEMFNGNMGGLDGADAICQGLADDAGLAGDYMAWLSTAQDSPSTRFTQSDMPYVLVNGTVVANSWADLTDGTLASAINLTETGGQPPVGNTSCAGGGFQTVWTATLQAGQSVNANNTCSGWTSTGGGSYWGRADSSNSFWTGWCSGNSCAWLSPIYCFQQ